MSTHTISLYGVASAYYAHACTMEDDRLSQDMHTDLKVVFDFVGQGIVRIGLPANSLTNEVPEGKTAPDIPESLSRF
jgi:hypothetical protein